ncbi:MAG: hypothetical protein CM1200mP28_00500 [Deltaproteobacteria bacterium]|nr:MAG: hypothetical protein CM1200mP28_00500 [Deltaproteobacteria bacterium]
MRNSTRFGGGQGVSEPDRIMDIARLDPKFSPGGFVVLVDAGEVQNRSKDPYINNIVLKQLQAAELLIVNKTDLVRGRNYLNWKYGLRMYRLMQFG